MPIRHPNLDPEFAAALDSLPRKAPLPNVADTAAWEAIRLERARSEGPPAGSSEHVLVTDQYVPGPEGAPDIRLRIHRPRVATELLPAVFWIHGGGLVLGRPDQDDLFLRDWVQSFGIVVIAVGYRLAPGNPFPAGVEDCYAGLAWTKENASQLGISDSGLIVAGASAGAGLAAAVALVARDRRGPRIDFQLLMSPMLDDRNITPSSHEITDLGCWDRDRNITAWRAVLGSSQGGADVSSYAAPARATDLTGLPPAFIEVGTLDVFRDEDIDYATRLAQAGVPVELHVWPGAPHGFEDFSPNIAVARTAAVVRDAALRKTLARLCSRP